jgi:surfeit locus 1 family protein
MRRLIFPLTLGLGGAAILVALGLWQLQRLEWKAGVLAEIEARIAAAPGPLPADPDPARDRYRPVAVEGSYLEGEIAVLVSLKGEGPGYRIVAPFLTDAGRRILVDRGFIREEERGLPRQGGPATIEGNLHWPEETDRFTPPPDAERGIWFARDVPAMAEALGTEPVLLVLRTSSQTDTPVAPLPVDTAGIPNDHLQYAVTWFGLALVWLGMTAVLIRRITRRND